jgi:hypothetical protein
MSITEFLLARIAEDEAAASRYSLRNWRAVDGYTVQGDFGVAGRERVDSATDWGICRTAARSDADFIARHDPARVLRECEAKRRIVRMHERLGSAYPRETWTYPEAADTCATCGPGDSWQAKDEPYGEYPCLTLRVLASVYADHPDYRDEWRP